eukprot:15452491-Alexandrium_andersonii.AAC.1
MYVHVCACTVHACVCVFERAWVFLAYGSTLDDGNGRGGQRTIVFSPHQPFTPASVSRRPPSTVATGPPWAPTGGC